MKVFISWSGDLSHRVARLMRDWLPLFLQPVKPWVSSEDLTRGVLWRVELAKQLEAGTVGVFCITRENLGSPWVNFEAGALSKATEASRAIPFFFDLRPSDVKGPLADLEGTTYQRGGAANAGEFRKLLDALNTVQDPSLVAEGVLTSTFAKMWPGFAPELEALLEDAGDPSRAPVAEPADPSGVLEEILQTVRDQRTMFATAFGDPRWTFRGNARLDPLSPGDYRDLALGLGMLKTLAEIEDKGLYHPPGSVVSTLLKLRDPLEVLLARAHAPRIHDVYFVEQQDDSDTPWPVTYTEDPPR